MDPIESKHIIVSIIIEELRCAQFCAQLAKLNMEMEDSLVSMVRVIQPLMGIPAPEGRDFPELSEKFLNTYVEMISKVREFPGLMERDELKSLAEAVYHLLLTCVSYERKKQNEY